MNRVGQKFRVLHIDGDTTADGVGRIETCSAYYTNKTSWPISAIAQDDDASPGCEMAFEESEVEWLE